MPRILDNINLRFNEALRDTLRDAQAADFCVGYLNLRGWSTVADLVDRFRGTGEDCCRVLVGMHRPPQELMRDAQRAVRQDAYLDGPTLARLKGETTRSFKEQLEFGVPTSDAEAALQRLARQLRAKKVRVKLFLRYPLHAKLYLIRRGDPVTPLIGYVGSSNLTLAGVSAQGELNVDVVEQDAAQKLQVWFDERWNDKLALDISDQLAGLIETSWAREELVRPHLVYLKMAYHLCEDARRGEGELKLPGALKDVLLDFQVAAVALTTRHLRRNGGVLLGDVVGLGKTLMATAVAAIADEQEQTHVIVVCPPKLQPMWQWHMRQYGIPADVVSLGSAIESLRRLRPPRPSVLMVIDESHNLRNREAKRYRAIRDYIQTWNPRVLLVTATPYNKQFTDLSNQLRLFVDEQQDVHVRPQRFFESWAAEGRTDDDFIAKYQASPRSLRAFEESLFPEDWRDLMRLFLVRRTRRFIIQTYAKKDEQKNRYYVMLNGQRNYFPLRLPRTVKYHVDDSDSHDQYARLYRESVVHVIEDLALPRYGLANYLVKDAAKLAKGEEKTILDNLNRAGRRLIGFCRTNLFKRLESSGFSFLLSLRRHVLRNMVTHHALQQGLPVPIGTQDAAALDTLISDLDDESARAPEAEASATGDASSLFSQSFSDDLKSYRTRAAEIYGMYREELPDRFDWLDPKFFSPDLKKALLQDAQALLGVLRDAGKWKPERDAKLDALHLMLTKTHGKDKVLVFSQFADTALYLAEQLQARGLTDLEVATSDSEDPVALARRFSPQSNGGLKPGEEEIRVLIATDVLAEGQNLQDGHIVVNFDLPWAIIRLIQRAGRVDRIGQKHDSIFVHSFLPADGVEQIIRLRARLFRRLRENQEVIGTDESFFGEEAAQKLRNLYTEKAGVLDDDEDEDVDLSSIALQVWNSASEADRKAAEQLPPVISSTRPMPQEPDRANEPPGVLSYLRFPDGADAIVRVDERGHLMSQSLTAGFRAAACPPETPALPRAENHHGLVAKSVRLAVQEQVTLGGQLGSLRSIRRQVYERLKRYREQLQREAPLYAAETLKRLDPAFNAIFLYPLIERSRDQLSRELRLDIRDEDLAKMVIRLHEEQRLCNVTERIEQPEPQIVCSLGFRRDA